MRAEVSPKLLDLIKEIYKRRSRVATKKKSRYLRDSTQQTAVRALIAPKLDVIRGLG